MKISDTIISTSPILLEAANYDSMFQDIKLLMGETPREVTEAVADARRMLKKQDRVIWYLRLWKIGYVEHLTAAMANHAAGTMDLGPDPYGENPYQTARPPLRVPAGVKREEVPPAFTEGLLWKKLVADYARRAGITPKQAEEAGYYVYHDRHLLVELEHFLSLPIAAIQNKVFTFDDPDNIRREFDEHEKEWQNEAKGAFADEDIKPLIKFPDGFAWFDLQKAYCGKEADAMGHCGNAPRKHTGDNILSLRKMIQRGDKVLYKPYLTFILDSSGMLGEMKGRFNKKPEPAFHPHILKLLLHPVVKGIKGGGYMPQNNFSINDLDTETREEILEKKPELGDLRAVYEKYGINDSRFEAMLEQQIEPIEPPSLRLYDDDGDPFYELDEWDDLERFASNIDDDTVISLLSVIDSNGEDIEIDELDEEQVYDMIDGLPDEEYRLLMRHLGVEPVPHNDTLRHRRAVQQATEAFFMDPLYEESLEIASASVSLGEDGLEKIKDRVRAYLEVGYYFHGSHQYVAIDKDDFNASVSLRIDAGDLVNIVAASDETDYDDDYHYAYHDIKQHGWETVDWDNVRENRKEAGLQADSNKPDPIIDSLSRGMVIDLNHVGLELVRRNL